MTQTTFVPAYLFLVLSGLTGITLFFWVFTKLFAPIIREIKRTITNFV